MTFIKTRLAKIINRSANASITNLGVEEIIELFAEISLEFKS